MNSSQSDMVQSPSLRTVFNAQLFAVVRGIRIEIIIFLVALVLFSALKLFVYHSVVHMNFKIDRMVVFSSSIVHQQVISYNLLTLMAFILPFGVWRSESPARRVYHWLMPVSQHTHSIIKVLSGWVWLLVGLVLCMLISILIVLICGGKIDTTVMRWIQLFSGPSIVYLLMSAFIVATNYPWKWLLGMVFGYFLIMVILDNVTGGSSAMETLSKIFLGPYGVFTTVWKGTTPFILEMNNSFEVNLGNRARIYNTWEYSTAAMLWTTIGIVFVYAAAYWQSRSSLRK